MNNARFKEWLLPLAGLISWPVIGAFVIVVSLFIGTGGGSFQGMAMAFASLGLIVAVNIASLIATAVLFFQRKKANTPLSLPLKIALIYYALLLVVALITMGPRELLNDSATVVGALFKVLSKGL